MGRSMVCSGGTCDVTGYTTMGTLRFLLQLFGWGTQVRFMGPFWCTAGNVLSDASSWSQCLIPPLYLLYLLCAG